MRIRVRMACGHLLDWEEGTDRPRCDACQEVRIGAVSAAPPRFRGLCEGPTAVREALDPLPVPGMSHG